MHLNMFFFLITSSNPTAQLTKKLIIFEALKFYNIYILGNKKTCVYQIYGNMVNLTPFASTICLNPMKIA